MRSAWWAGLSTNDVAAMLRARGVPARTALLMALCAPGNPDLEQRVRDRVAGRPGPRPRAYPPGWL